jgi:hypothetical protein
MTIKYCYEWSLFGRLRTYPRCEEHDKIKFTENKLSRGPLLNYSPTPGGSADHRWGASGLEHVGASTSHNPMGLHGLLQE